MALVKHLRREEENAEEEMEGKRWDEEEMQDILVVKEDIMVNFSLSPFPLVSFLSSSCFKVLPPKKLENKQI